MSGGDRKALKKELSRSSAIHGMLHARSIEARARGESLVREADKLACESFNERLWSLGGPLQPSPTIAEAINAGMPLLKVRCTRCRAHRSIDMEALRMPRGRAVGIALAVASQQFYLGAAFARGFYGLEFSGDTAAAGSIEMRFDQTLPWKMITRYQLYGYLDHTRVWNVNDTAALKLTLAGAGAGVRFYLPSALQATVEVSAPIEYATPFTQTRETRVFFGVSKAFKFCAMSQWICS